MTQPLEGSNQWLYKAHRYKYTLVDLRPLRAFNTLVLPSLKVPLLIYTAQRCTNYVQTLSAKIRRLEREIHTVVEM